MHTEIVGVAKSVLCVYAEVYSKYTTHSHIFKKPLILHWVNQPTSYILFYQRKHVGK